MDKARDISEKVKSCAQMEEIAKTNPSQAPARSGRDPARQRQPAPFRDLLSSLPVGQASQPLVAGDGIAVVIVCSKEQKNAAVLTKEDVRRQLISERVEMASRQLMRDLRRKATIQRFDHPS